MEDLAELNLSTLKKKPRDDFNVNLKSEEKLEIRATTEEDEEGNIVK